MAMIAGRAMRPFSGKKIGGMMPPRLPKKTNTNRVVRYGRKRSPSRPMTSSTIWPRTKSTIDSITFWSPDGTSLGLAEGEEEQPPDQQRDQEHLEHHAVDAEVDAGDLQVDDVRPLEDLDAGGVEALPLLGQGKRR